MLKPYDDFASYNTFIVRTVSKGVIPNSLRDVVFKGWQTPDSKNNLTIFSGLAVAPPANLLDNFKMLSTDYTTFAILYNCLPYANMNWGENVLVLTRKNFEFQLDKPTQTAIEREFTKLFGNPTDGKKKLTFSEDMMKTVQED